MGNVQIRRHFKRRIKERYGLDISKNDIREMQKKIKPNNFLFSKSQGRKVHKIEYKNIELLVVYDVNRKVLVTALTLEKI